MKSVKQVSKITGVSVRTLHHYDAIGLLKPTQVTEAGYRLYDDTALERLQMILLFKELRFSLKEIKTIIDSPKFEKEKAIKQQITLLKLQRKRLDDLIIFAREIITKGVNKMDFSVFDKTDIEKYTAQAKSEWGDTDAYKEYEQKSNNQTDETKMKINEKLMMIFVEFGNYRCLNADCEKVQNTVEKLHRFINENYYTCTLPMLNNLGQMYVEDIRFKENIDKYGGVGTAEFANKAISIYCNNKTE